MKLDRRWLALPLALLAGLWVHRREATPDGAVTRFTPVADSLDGFAGCMRWDAATINASAKFQIDSTTKGFLPPRMTTTERDAISSPPAGLMIYNTTTNKLNVYTTAWEAITSA